MRLKIGIFLLALCAISGFTTEIIWTGATDTNFATGSNWVDGTAPGVADTAVFRGTVTNQPVIPAATEYEIGSIRFETGGWVLSGADSESRLKFGQGSVENVLRVRVESGTVEFTVPVRHVKNGPSQLWEIVTGAYLKTAGIHDGFMINLKLGSSSETAGTLELAGTIDNDGLFPQVMYGTLLMNKGGSSGSSCGNLYVGPNGIAKYGSTRTSRNPGQVYRYAGVDGVLDLNGDGVNSPLANWRLQGLRGSGRIINSGSGMAILYLQSSSTNPNGDGIFSGTIDDFGTQPIRVEIENPLFVPCQYFTGTNTYSGPTVFKGGYTGTLYNAQSFGYTNSVIYFNNNSVLDLNGQVCDKAFTNSTGNTGARFINTSEQTAVMRGFFSMPDANKNFYIGGDNDMGDIVITNAMIVKNNCRIVKQGPQTLTLAGSADNDGLRVAVEGGKVIFAKDGIRACGGNDAGGAFIYNGSEIELAGTDTDQIWNDARVIIDNGIFSINNGNEIISTFTLGNETADGWIRGDKLSLYGSAGVNTYLIRGKVDSYLERAQSNRPQTMYKISTNEVSLNNGVRLNGAIIVSNGVLRVNGAIASDTSVSVLTDGALAGSGVISNSVTLTGSAKLHFTLGATPAQTDKLTVTGALTADN